MTHWMTASTVFFIAPALSSTDSSFALRSRRTLGGRRRGSGTSCWDLAVDTFPVFCALFMEYRCLQRKARMGDWLCGGLASIGRYIGVGRFFLLFSVFLWRFLGCARFWTLGGPVVFRFSLVLIGFDLRGECDLHTLPLVWTWLLGWGFLGGFFFFLPFLSFSCTVFLGGLGVPGQGAGSLRVWTLPSFFVSWEYSFP